MSPSKPSLLSITSWNVHGLSEKFFLGNKLSNDEFLLSFKHCDILILTETWRSDQFTLPGYDLFTNPSRKHHKKKNGRSSGGIALGFKTAGLKQGIKFILGRENFIWIKLGK